MGANTGIEWCHATFNPWRGCTKVSEGCKFCYAETLSKRNPAALGEWGPRGRRVVAAESYWRQPLKWNVAAEREGVRRRVFVASLADVFEDRPELDAPRRRLWETISACTALDWLLLTKRPENILRMAPMIDGDGRHWLTDGWPDHIWIGTSVEDQDAADKRIPELLRVPARVRFLSCEPLIGPVDLTRWVIPACEPVSHVDWIIAGGESGPNARPMHPAWARSLRDQCEAAGVPLFFKQHGEYREWDDRTEVDGPHLGEWAIVTPTGKVWHSWRGFTNPNPAHVATAPDGSAFVAKVGKKKAGRVLDGRTWDELPAE